MLCQVSTKPRNDNGYFVVMTKVIFRSGLSWTMIEDKWPNFRKAFGGFVIAKVARFGEPDVERLMKDTGIVRNYRKIMATIDNARELQAIQRQHGSVRAYLDEVSRDGEDALCKALGRRFSFLGGSTAVFFLRCVGEKMPETIRRWEEGTRKKKATGAKDRRTRSA
ncbi:MAG: DNA-3-methyladenine glycosylase I [Nitrospirae bacterium]|nr:DNA-3-methyladenine glycosylase I [Nitrospirota bacterium]